MFRSLTSPIISPLCLPQSFPSSIINKNASSQSPQNASPSHDSILFSSHHEPVLQRPNVLPIPNELFFLNSPATTISQHSNPVTYPSPSIENHHSPMHSSSSKNCHSPLIDNYQHTFENSCSPPTSTFLKFALPSTKDIPFLTRKHDWGP
jgi:hypothetical protein